jgi:GT2 family glycosyltransferase
MKRDGKDPAVLYGSADIVVAEPAVVALARSALTSGYAALSVNDRVAALRWLDRAHRLVPHDPNTTLALASVLAATAPARARELFQRIAINHDVRQAWLGLAAAHLRLTHPAEAGVALATMLSRHAFEPDAAMLAQQIVDGSGSAGWCGLRSDGMLEIHAPGDRMRDIPGNRIRVIPGDRITVIPGDWITVMVDGQPIRGRVLPAAWERARTVEVRSGDTHLLGSPIRIDAIRRLVGCVEVWGGGIRGWAWHPGDPATAPKLTLVCPATRLERSITASDESITIANAGPLARPRGFHLARAALLDAAGPVHIRGVDGKDLAGSPLDPFADEANHTAASIRLGRIYQADPRMCGRPGPGRDGSMMAWATGTMPADVSPALRADAPVPARPVGVDGRQRAVTVVIAVQDGGKAVLACLTSVLASVTAETRILVVDDASSDPVLVAALHDLARQGKICLIRHDRPLGFPASANAGILAAGGRDVVVLKCGTLVPPGWLERLHAAAYAARNIGSVSPLSNDTGILNYPGGAGADASSDQAATERLDGMAQRANGKAIIDIPMGTGCCLYLRRDCLNATGLFRAELFAQGSGEEHDLCLRAHHLGWRNVALPGMVVGRAGNGTVGDAAVHLRARNSLIIEQLHPGHGALMKDFISRDPLAEPRRLIDLLRWRDQGRKWKRAVVLITHDEGGGVEQRLRHAAGAHTRARCRPIVLRPCVTAAGDPAIIVGDGVSGVGGPGELANLVYAIPRELPALISLLRAARSEAIEAHHLADYPGAVYDLITQLGIPYDVHVHDYAWFCPRISLVAANNRYCGEPELRGCEACIADNGHFLREDIGVAALRIRSASFLAGARRVIVPSDDAGARMRRQFSGLATTTVPHEDDAAVQLAAARPSGDPGRPKVCVTGAIGVHKGYEVLLACARDAAQRDLDLEFIVVGHTMDDSRLLATGRVFVTGPFEPHEAATLIARQGARLAFLPSVWPETWCLALGDVWRAGLGAVVFDMGAPTERIRRTGHGIVIPVGLSPGAINNALLAAIRAREGQS